MAWSNIIGHGLAHGASQSFHPFVGAISQVSNYLAPIEVPSPEQVIDLYVRGWIDVQTLKDACALKGVNVDPTAAVALGRTVGNDAYKALWNSFAAAKAERPEEKEYFEIANRRLMTDDRVKSYLHRQGYQSEVYQDWVANLRYDIPGPSDLVRFSVRHCWEPDLLAALGYNAEFPGAVIDYWHACKGLDYPLFSGPFSAQLATVLGSQAAAQGWLEQYVAATGVEPTWARFYWYSHWVLPSPGQGYDMMFRLRPDRDRSFDPPEAAGQNFTFDDLKLLLRANDYPPKYRPLLAAIAHRMPGVRFIRSFRATEVYSYDDVLEWAKRWGYSDRDASDIADNIEASVQPKTGRATACKGCATCDAAYELGILDLPRLQICYQDWGMSKEDAAKNATLADLKLRVKRVREITANVRKRYLKGTLSDQQASQLLQGLGLTLDRVGLYLQDWQLEFEAGRREISTAQAVKYACQGVISVPDLVVRLTNLGYGADDQEALVQEASVCAGNLSAQTQAKQARKTKQQQADAYTAARRARMSLMEAQRYLASHGSPKQLHDWFCQGAIGEPEVYMRLNALGWPDVDITRFLGDCKSGRKPVGRGGYGVVVKPALVPPSKEGGEIESIP